MHDVAVAQNVFFAFKTQPPGLTGTLLSLILNEIIIRNRLGPDKAPFEIRMNLTCRLRGGRATAYGSRTYLLGSSSEKCLQT